MTKISLTWGRNSPHKQTTTMERTLSIGEQYFRYNNSDSKDFGNLRCFMFRLTNLDKMWVHQLAELFDRVRELAVGEEVYFCDSRRELYVSHTLRGLEHDLNMMQRAADKEAYMKPYAPEWENAWVIEKTDKRYILRALTTD